eukprot:3341065-Ditylum_brightwellii.AAC.1
MMDRLRFEYMDTSHFSKEYSAAMSQAAMMLCDIETYWSAAECQDMDNKPSETMPHYHSILYVKKKKRFELNKEAA